MKKQQLLLLIWIIGLIFSCDKQEEPPINKSVYSIEFEAFFRKNLELLGIVTPDWDQYLPKACDAFIHNRKELVALITHRFSIHEAGKAFTMYERHEDGILKALVNAAK